MEGWVTDATNCFVQVTLDEDFVEGKLDELRQLVTNWLEEPMIFTNGLVQKFNFLIDGKAKSNILEFISRNPRFEDICQELQVYNQYVDRTQEIASLAYFSFVR